MHLPEQLKLFPSKTSLCWVQKCRTTSLRPGTAGWLLVCAQISTVQVSTRQRQGIPLQLVLPGRGASARVPCLCFLQAPWSSVPQDGVRQHKSYAHPSQWLPLHQPCTAQASPAHPRHAAFLLLWKEKQNKKSIQPSGVWQSQERENMH